MTSYFIGGAVGSALSAWVYGRAGWSGVAICGAAFGLATLLVWLVRWLNGKKGRAVPTR